MLLFAACERRYISDCRFSQPKGSDSQKYVCVRRLCFSLFIFFFSQLYHSKLQLKSRLAVACEQAKWGIGRRARSGRTQTKPPDRPRLASLADFLFAKYPNWEPVRRVTRWDKLTNYMSGIDFFFSWHCWGRKLR